MKITLVTIVSIVFSLASYAQTQEEIDALSEFLSADKLAYLQENNELGLKQMAVLNKSYHLSEYGAKDVDDLPSISLVSKKFDSLPDISEELIANGDLNLLGYNFEISRSNYSYYRMDDGNKVFVIPPTDLSLERSNLETY